MERRGELCDTRLLAASCWLLGGKPGTTVIAFGLPDFPSYILLCIIAFYYILCYSVISVGNNFTSLAIF